MSKQNKTEVETLKNAVFSTARQQARNLINFAQVANKQDSDRNNREAEIAMHYAEVGAKAALDYLYRANLIR